MKGVNIFFNCALTRATKEAYEATPTLNILISSVQMENLARIRSAKIAESLGVSLQTVERHIKKLQSKQIIELDEVEEGKKRAVSNWRICPYLVWHGKTEALKHYVDSLPEDHIWRAYNDDKPNT